MGQHSPGNQNTKCADSVRRELTDELFRRYVTGTKGAASFRRTLRFFRKRVMWATVVRGTQIFKRALDIAGSFTLLALGMPFFFIVGLLIKLTDNGPILFWQTRVGFRGKEFACPKFRSMVTNAEEIKKKIMEQNDHDDSITFKMKRDPRVTWIGRIIRKTSIDELPQLLCILKGEMSFVGPRPPVPQEVAQYSLADRRRLEVVPGLTCFWQVKGRGDIPFDQQVKLDVEYIESQSLWLDIKLLFMTIPAVLFGKGAY